MAEPTLDIDAVTRLIADVSREIVLPKFRALGVEEIYRKPTAGHLDDLVTVVDRDAEARLTEGLLAIVPAAHVIGEEAAHSRPELIALLNDDGPLWIVDPLDGTSNFASGDDRFGIMVSFVMRAQVRAAWVHLAARDEMFVAQAGAGAYCNGERLRVPHTGTIDVPRGTLFVRYMPADLRERVISRAAGHFVRVPNAGAAALGYTDVLRGRKEFAVYYRLLPWDHAAPALILTEGGGCVAHLSGEPYTVRSPNQLTFVARDTEVASRLRGWLDPR